MPRSKRYRFPWREGHRFELLVDGKSFFPAMLEAIRQARTRVFLESYLFESGFVAERFIAACRQCSRRGVPVYLLLDDFGALALNGRDRKRLLHAGVHLTFYNPLRYTGLRRNLFRDHRKLLAVDGQTAFVGGMGITDSFDPAPTSRQLPWHEVMLKVEGPVIADWEAAFCRTWNRWSAEPLSPSGHRAGVPGPGAPGRVSTSAGPNRQEVKRSLINRTRRARQRVWLATAYFIPSRKLRRVLRRAARNGVDVRLLLPGSQSDHPAVRQAGRRFYARLLRHGVRIYEYQPRFIHAKILLCDDWVSIGSSNIDRWTLRWNLEANQEAIDPGLARRVQTLFEDDFAQSVEYTAAAWHRRSRWARLAEWFWGVVDLWVDRLTQPRR